MCIVGVGGVCWQFVVGVLQFFGEGQWQYGVFIQQYVGVVDVGEFVILQEGWVGFVDYCGGQVCFVCCGEQGWYFQQGVVFVVVEVVQYGVIFGVDWVLEICCFVFGVWFFVVWCIEVVVVEVDWFWKCVGGEV